VPYIQRNMPAPPKTLSWAINSFEGGLNNALSEILIQDNQATDICNLDFTDDAVIESRGGFKVTNTLPVAGNITFMDMFNPTYADVKKIAICNGDLYVDNVNILASKNITTGTQFNDKYYLINGTEIYVLGKFPQELSAHIKPWGTPIPDEVVLKVVTPPEGYVPLDNTNQIGMYHYDYDNMTCWYEPCQNELDDEFKGKNVFPTSPTLITVHSERLIIISDLDDPGSIYISDINGAFYYPASLGLHIPPKGDRIVGMTVFTDSVVVGTNKELYAIYGETNRDTVGMQYTMKKINTHTGFKNNTSIHPMHNNLVYVGADSNIYSMYTTKTDVSVLMTNILNRTVDLEKHPINATVDMLNKSTTAFCNDKYYVLIPDLKIILVYSYRYMAWTVYRTVLNIQTMHTYSNDIVFADNGGKMYILDKQTYHDDSNPFATYWHSKRFSFGDNTIYKKYKEMYVVAHTFDDIRSDIKTTYEVDYVDIKQQSVITNQISKWGITGFGERFITRNIAPSFPITIGQRGRYIKFILYNGYFVDAVFATYTDMDSAEKENQACYYVTENDTYYFYDTGTLIELAHEQVKQPMKIYSVSGTYQMKGRR